MPGTPVTTTSPPPPPKGCELLRENVFESARHADEDEFRMRRKPTMTRHEDRLVAPKVFSDKRYTVVLDLDETVVYAREGPLYARAHLRELLVSIKDDFEVIVWTAGERDYAKNILEEINQDHIIHHLIYRHKAWYTSDDYTKDLKKLGRNIDYVIIVENTPDCVRANPQNGIIVEDFEVPSATPSLSQEKEPMTPGGGKVGTPPSRSPSQTPPPKPKRQFTDRTLLLLKEVLSALLDSGETVPVFLAGCPLLAQRSVRGSDGKGIPIYYLGKRRRRGAPPICSPKRKRSRETLSQSGGEWKNKGEGVEDAEGGAGSGVGEPPRALARVGGPPVAGGMR
ncbi:nuclear lim interactor-interacting factor [Trypanosoma grayi]|uniref:nuclear lim interactor-interacting factor n=1 Tax=Trypanosoma grayi TaxID=71804 RepID=UPI0004F451DF|nr:nuclear lim interactor-interacting factor [Trypanosoma grayi]KEG08359.1 nuclear lim interactor-interacting factor [Trypanosoma grayi]